MDAQDHLQVSILKLLVRKPEQGRYKLISYNSLDRALDQLRNMYPNFLDQIIGKKVVDFGCGEGLQALAIAQAGAHQVVGVDKNEHLLIKAREKAKGLGINNVKFCEHIDTDIQGIFDCLISHNSMEHFSDPLLMLKLFQRLVHPGGEIFITFGPPWYSPYGAHTQFFCKIPWIHLLFSEKAVLFVRNNFTTDIATCYENVAGGLNRMSLAKFHSLLKLLDCQPVYSKYVYMLGCGFLHKVPLLKELCLYHINVILKPNNALGQYCQSNEHLLN